MRFFFLLSVFLSSCPALAAAELPPPIAHCLPASPPQGEPDGWLLLAALVVCMAGRLAAQPRR